MPGKHLTGIKSPDIPDNLVIPSMPEINLFLVDLAFVTNRTTRINSVTLPDMIRGVYNSSGKTLYVDTLYVEGDYERMVNNVERIRTLCSYDMQYIPVVYYNKPFVPALIPKVVMYNGQPLRHYVGAATVAVWLMIRSLPIQYRRCSGGQIRNVRIH